MKVEFENSDATLDPLLRFPSSRFDRFIVIIKNIGIHISMVECKTAFRYKGIFFMLNRDLLYRICNNDSVLE